MDRIRNSKALSILVIACIYIVAACIGIWAYMLLPFRFWAKLLNGIDRKMVKFGIRFWFKIYASNLMSA
jgi:hypothetical protein